MELHSNFIRNVSLGYGVFLIAWGSVISIVSQAESFTSYIPSMLGAPLAVSGFMVMRKPEDRKLWMHVAATVGLLCALFGTRFFMVMGDGITYASGSQLMLLITGTAVSYTHLPLPTILLV